MLYIEYGCGQINGTKLGTKSDTTSFNIEYLYKQHHAVILYERLSVNVTLNLMCMKNIAIADLT